MLIKKGQWYTICCEIDLTQAEEDLEKDDDIGIRVWNSKEEALKDL